MASPGFGFSPFFPALQWHVCVSLRSASLVVVWRCKSQGFKSIVTSGTSRGDRFEGNHQ